MKITWRDGITTATVVAAIFVERAYFHNWGWPLVHELGWSIVAVMLAGYICFRLSFAFDENAGTGWSIIAYVSTSVAAILAAAGVLLENADFLTALTGVLIFFWISSIIQHLRTSKPANQSLAHQ